MSSSTETTDRRAVEDEMITAYGRLVEAQRHLHRIFDRSLRNAAGISIVWYEALLRLARSPEHHLPINELGEALDLTSGGATRLVDRLEENGYVDRIPCAADRRISWAKLTEQGLELVTDATGVHVADLDEHFVSRFTEKEMDTLTDLLCRLRHGT